VADPSADLVVRGVRGFPHGLIIPAGELSEAFSRSSGPGGQSVNTADSRVELRFDVRNSVALADYQRERVLSALPHRLVNETVVVVAAEHRSQLRNRTAARVRLAALLAEALQPPGPTRRSTRPSRAAMQRRVEAKKRRAAIKGNRGRIQPD
jgi:ribosome-associated protein